MKSMNALALASIAVLALALPAVAAEQPAAGTAAAVKADSAPKFQTSLEGAVEAIRQTTLSSQVAGAVVSIHVKAGDRVKAGQALIRIDARAADEGVAASAAQLGAAQAQAKVASRDLERQKFLFDKQYISQAALDRVQAQADAAQAQVNALQAQTKAARAQSGYFIISAPYSGVVSEVPVVQGDMALPGRPLLTIYDPTALRVSTAVPQALLAGLAGKLEAVLYEVSGAAPQKPARSELLPAIDPTTHTAQLRLNLAPGQAGLVPGMFARVLLPVSGDGKLGERVFVAASAVVRRAEMTGVYVAGPQGKPLLRQVRLGRSSGDQVEVLSGLRPGDKVVAEPSAAPAATR